MTASQQNNLPDPAGKGERRSEEYEKEHERWVDERIKKGWVYGRVRNDQERIHHCIVPWEQLPEYQRERDRNAIRALPELLAKVHLKIIRLDES